MTSVAIDLTLCEVVCRNNVVVRGRATGVRSGPSQPVPPTPPPPPTSTINTSDITKWTLSPDGTANIQNTNQLFLQSRNSSQNNITTFLGLETNAFTLALLALFPSSGATSTNGTATRYNETVTLTGTQTLTFSWTISGGDVGNSSYLDNSWIVITNSTNGQNGIYSIATTVSPGSGTTRSGTFSREFPAGSFTVSFAVFNGSDTAQDMSLFISNVVFT